MLAIKLAKVGKTNKKVFRIIISEKSRDTFGNALEILGSYNPYSKEFQVKADRVKYWLSKGAQMTPTVNNLFIDQKVIEGDKVTASKKGAPKESKKGEKKEAPADGAETPAEEAKTEEVKEEAPTEETKTEEVKEESPKEEVKEEKTEEKKEEEAPKEEVKEEKE